MLTVIFLCTLKIPGKDSPTNTLEQGMGAGEGRTIGMLFFSGILPPNLQLL